MSIDKIPVPAKFQFRSICVLGAKNVNTHLCYISGLSMVTPFDHTHLVLNADFMNCTNS